MKEEQTKNATGKQSRQTNRSSHTTDDRRQRSSKSSTTGTRSGTSGYSRGNTKTGGLTSSHSRSDGTRGRSSSYGSQRRNGDTARDARSSSRSREGYAETGAHAQHERSNSGRPSRAFTGRTTTGSRSPRVAGGRSGEGVKRSYTSRTSHSSGNREYPSQHEGGNYSDNHTTEERHYRGSAATRGYSQHSRSQEGEKRSYGRSYSRDSRPENSYRGDSHRSYGGHHSHDTEGGSSGYRRADSTRGTTNYTSHTGAGAESGTDWHSSSSRSSNYGNHKGTQDSRSRSSFGGARSRTGESSHYGQHTEESTGNRSRFNDRKPYAGNHSHTADRKSFASTSDNTTERRGRDATTRGSRIGVAKKRKAVTSTAEVHLAKRELPTEIQATELGTTAEGTVASTTLSGKEQAKLARTAAKQHSSFMNEYYAVTNLTHNDHAEQVQSSSLANNLPKKDYQVKTQVTSYKATKDSVKTSFRATRPARRFTLDGTIITAPNADNATEHEHKHSRDTDAGSNARFSADSKVGVPVYRADSVRQDLMNQRQGFAQQTSRKTWIAEAELQPSIVAKTKGSTKARVTSKVAIEAPIDNTDEAMINGEVEEFSMTTKSKESKNSKNSKGSKEDKESKSSKDAKESKHVKPASKAVVTKKTMARMAAVQLLYQILLAETITPGRMQQLTETELQSLLDTFIANGLAEACFQMQNLHKAFQKQLCIELLQAALQESATIKAELAQFLTNNSFSDLNLITQSIILLGVAELHHFSDTPVKVVINEYLDIANCFLEKGQTSLINGVLDKTAKASVVE